MTAVSPITPPPEGTVFTRDPVKITTAVFVLLQGVVSILTATSVFDEVLGGILMGVLTAAWASVNVLLVKPATVPLQPLQELAYAEQHKAA
jgi:hypothetical protein